MKNPLTRIREGLKMQKIPFAQAIGVSYSTLWAVEQGLSATLGERVLAGVQGLGYDPAQLAQEYAEWRNAAQAQRVAEVQASRQAASASV